MLSYVYNGKSKFYAKPAKKQAKKKLLFKNMGFVLCGAHPVGGFKVNGSNLLTEYLGSEIIEYQLDLINSICEDPEIIVVTGIAHNQFVKHSRRSEFSIVENQLYEFSNSAEDLRLSLNALKSPHLIFIDSGFIPTIDTYKYLLGHKDRTTKVFIKDVQDPNYVGVNIGSNGYVANFSFLAKNSLTGMYYINTNDIQRIRKKSISKNFSKNKFAFEMLEELKTKAILDESESVVVVR